MRSKLINSGAQRTFVAVLATGDEAFACLRRFIREERLSAAQITAIGALSGAVLGYFDWERKEYKRIPVTEQVEVVSLVGDVALDPKGEPCCTRMSCSAGPTAARWAATCSRRRCARRLKW
jgi:uncharacterized protein